MSNTTQEHCSDEGCQKSQSIPVFGEVIKIALQAAEEFASTDKGNTLIAIYNGFRYEEAWHPEGSASLGSYWFAPEEHELYRTYGGGRRFLNFQNEWSDLMPAAKKVYEDLNSMPTVKAELKASDLREGIRKALVMFDIHELWLMVTISVEFINENKPQSE